MFSLHKHSLVLLIQLVTKSISVVNRKFMVCWNFSLKIITIYWRKKEKIQVTTSSSFTYWFYPLNIKNNFLLHSLQKTFFTIICSKHLMHSEYILFSYLHSLVTRMAKYFLYLYLIEMQNDNHHKFKFFYIFHKEHDGFMSWYYFIYAMEITLMFRSFMFIDEFIKCCLEKLL